jgi:hypothetical protein
MVVVKRAVASGKLISIFLQEFCSVCLARFSGDFFKNRAQLSAAFLFGPNYRLFSRLSALFGFARLAPVTELGPVNSVREGTF